MKRILSSILTAAAILPVFVGTFEAQLNIVPRFHAGTIQADVDRSQGRKSLDIQLEGANDEQTAMLLEAHANKVERNMNAIRAHVICVEKPELCGNQGWQPNNR